MTLPRLYAVIDADVAAAHGWTVVDLARACLDGGATCLQLRAKARTFQWTLEAADALVAMAGEAATVIVNDRADIARLACASGVHLGQDDLSPARARQVVGRAAVGLSTHTPPQIDAAILEPIDYVAVGPVYGTVTKDTGFQAVGYRPDSVCGDARPVTRRRIPGGGDWRHHLESRIRGHRGGGVERRRDLGPAGRRKSRGTRQSVRRTPGGC